MNAKSRYQATIDALPEQIAILDQHGFILVVNKHWRDFADNNGLQWEDYGIGKNYLAVCDNASNEYGPNEEAKKVSQGIRDVLNMRKEVFSLEYPCHSPTESRWFILRVSLLEHGKSPNLLVAHFDITKRKLAELEYKESENRYRTLVENLNDALFVLGKDGCIWDVNSEACRRYAYSPEEFRQLNVSDLDNQAVHSELYQTLLEKGSHQFETTHVSSEGSKIPVDVIARLIKYKGQTWILALARDISAKKEAERLSEDIDRIARHDLKTPLNGIIGLPQAMLMDDNLTKEQREYLDYIQQSGYRMLNMIDMTLSLYKMEQGTYVCEPQSVEILSVLRRVEYDLSSELKSFGINLQVLTEDKEAFSSEFYVWGEEMLCYSVISNLVKNAIEDSPRNGTVTITMYTAKNGEDKFISIHNDSVIPEDIRPVFGEKYKTSGKKEGTGLGVYSARLMIEAMGGILTWSTSEEEGTTVVLSLPQPA